VSRLLKPIVLVLALFASTPAGAAGPLLEVPVWTEIEPPFVTAPESPETLRLRLLEQARVVIGAMIYGYRFVYTPSDRARGVADRFEVTPIGEVPWGDPRLSVVWVLRQKDRISGRIAYELADFQSARRRAWSTNTLPTATGRAEESLFAGPEARQQSLTKAIEQAIRDYARGRMDNKPRELRGEVVIWEPPYTVFGAGSYQTTVKVKLRIDEAVPYRVF
jgi:hypothetical protein